MAYTNTWDETAPADTSLASLVGQDIRTFKLDIRERVAQMSGTLANRPTPEAAWAGLLYFATDTDQAFQWNGNAWVGVTLGWAGLFYSLFNYQSQGSTLPGQTLLTWNIPPMPPGPAGLRFRIQLTNAPNTVPITSLALFGPAGGMIDFAGQNGIPVNYTIQSEFVMSNLTGVTNAQGGALMPVFYPSFGTPFLNNFLPGAVVDVPGSFPNFETNAGWPLSLVCSTNMSFVTIDFILIERI
jgi:hypothetical protein